MSPVPLSLRNVKFPWTGRWWNCISSFAIKIFNFFTVWWTFDVYLGIASDGLLHCLTLFLDLCTVRAMILCSSKPAYCSEVANVFLPERLLKIHWISAPAHMAFYHKVGHFLHSTDPYQFPSPCINRKWYTECHQLLHCHVVDLIHLQYKN